MKEGYLSGNAPPVHPSSHRVYIELFLYISTKSHDRFEVYIRCDESVADLLQHGIHCLSIDHSGLAHPLQSTGNFLAQFGKNHG